MTKRRAQIVRNGICKGLEFVVGGFQLRRALQHLRFEFLIEFADLQFIRLNGAVVGSVVGMLLTLLKLVLG